MADFNDEPISSPSEDKFGIDPFAKTIAKCIEKLQKPVGSVVAIHGPWGSGKSSVINLIRVHLDEIDPNLKIVQFRCWLYRTEDAITVGFFRELYAGLSPSLSKGSRSRKSLRKLGAHVAVAGDLLGVVVGAATGSFWGKILKSTSRVLENYIKNDKSIESLQSDVAEALNDSKQRFLVVVDDIDRLSPDEALVIFRLIKSIGCLPYVAYLLAYDRERTERAVEERYPSEGSHYLEKIVQAGFELPEPSQAHLIAMLEANLNQIFGDIGSNDSGRADSLFHEIVIPEIQTPRDVHRLANAVSVTYPAVAGEVDAADFLSIETLRLFRPALYQSVRTNKSKLVGLGETMMIVTPEQLAKNYETEFLGHEPEGDRSKTKYVLMKLFPRLESIWSSTKYSDEQSWARKRRVCSELHFDTYFQFCLSPYTIPHSEIQALIRRADDPVFVRSQFRKALRVHQAEGRTKASFLLDEMRYHSQSIPVKNVRQFLSALYFIADEFDVDCDKAGGGDPTENRLRLRWLTRALLLDRTKPSERSTILMEACQDASVKWLVELSDTAHHDHYPSTNGEKPLPPEECLMTKGEAKSIRGFALQRVRESANNGTLINIKDLREVLFSWHNMAGKTSKEVRKFCTDTINTDEGVVAFARAFLHESYIYGLDGFGPLGDAVGRKKDYAKIDCIEKLMDPNQFRRRLVEVGDEPALPESDKIVIQRLLDAWRARDQGKE